jgi:hypothetical protein
MIMLMAIGLWLISVFAERKDARHFRHYGYAVERLAAIAGR